MPEHAECSLCGATDPKPRPELTGFLELSPPFQVSECRSCGLTYMSPRPTPSELIQMYLKEPYFSKANADRGASRTAFYDARMGRLERVIKRPGRLLGIGCLEGGYALEVAQSRGWDVEGVESSEILSGYAREELAIPVKTVHGWDLSAVETEAFDAVYTHSFEHFSDPRRVLRHVRRILKRGGYFMVEVPNQFYSVKDKVRRVLMSLLGRRKYLLFRKPPPFDFHLYYFSPRTLENMLRQEQFEAVALRTYLPHHPVYLCNPRGRWMQEALYAVGGLVGRGPSIEVIASKSGDLV